MKQSHLSVLHELPCVVTLALEGRRVRAEVVHHIESVRDELSDYGGVPMTDYWHKELHRLSRRGFENRTKLSEIDMLCITIKLLVERKE